MSDREALVMRETMAAIVETAPGSPELPPVASEATHPRRVALPALVAASLIVIAVVAVGGAVLMQDTAQESATDTATSVPAGPATTLTSVPSSPTTSPVSTPVSSPEMTWTRVMDEPALDGTVWALAHNGEMVVAVGDDYNEDEGYNDTPNVVIWTSIDGRSWNRSYKPGVFGGVGIQQAYQITDGPLGFVIAGEDVPNTVLWFPPPTATSGSESLTTISGRPET